MTTLHKFVDWLKSNSTALLAALSALAGGAILLFHKRSRVVSVKDALKVEETRKTIAKDEGRVAELRDQADAKESDVQKLEDKIKKSKRRVVEIQEGKALPDETDDDVVRRFSDSGL